MDYTTSIDNVVHSGTGRRMHSDSIAIPTALSANDANMVIWSLMEVLRLAGVGGKAFNPDDPVSYTRFRDALVATFAGLDSPAFRGSPQAPVPPQFDNTTKVAPTAFVQRALGNFSDFTVVPGVDTVLGAWAFGRAIQFSGAACTATLPPGNVAPPGAAIRFYAQGGGPSYTVKTAGAGDFIWAPGAGLGLTNRQIVLGSSDTLDLMSRGNGEWDVVGGSWIVSNETIAFNGKQTTVTPEQFEVSKRFATMEAVQRALGNYAGVTVVDKAITLTRFHAGQIIELNGSSTFVTTLPDGSTLGAAAVMEFVNQSGVDQTIAVQGTDSIWAFWAGKLKSFTIRSGDSLKLFSRGGQFDICDGSAMLQFSTSFGSSLAANGYQKMPSLGQPTGLIFQWGSVEVPGNSRMLVTFPIAFPNTCTSIACAVDDAVANGTQYRWTVGGRTKINFQAANNWTSPISGAWFAVGF